MKARLPQGYGSGGGTNLQHLAKQAQKMQADIEAKTAELEEKKYEAKSGGGAVTVVATGKMEIKSIEISQDVVDPDDVEMLSDLVMAAVNEALRNAAKDKEETLGAISGGLGSLNIPGLF